MNCHTIGFGPEATKLTSVILTLSVLSTICILSDSVWKVPLIVSKTCIECAQGLQACDENVVPVQLYLSHINEPIKSHTAL